MNNGNDPEFADNKPVLVKLPGIERITATYLGQVAPEYEVVAALGNPERIVRLIMPDVKSGLESALENDRIALEIKKSESTVQLESLRQEVAELDGPSATAGSRMKVLVDFLKESGKSGNYTLIEKMRRNEPLSQKDISQPVSQVYSILKAKARDVPKSIEYALSDYVHNGEADGSLLGLLAQTIPVFAKLAEFKTLASMPTAQAVEAIDYRALWRLLRNEVGNASGKPSEVTVNGHKVDVYRLLQEKTGMQVPEKPFLRRKEDIKGDGFFVPLRFKAAAVPEMKESYIPIQKLGHVVSLFDSAIRKILAAYSLSNDEIMRIDDTTNLLIANSILGSVLMPPLFPKDHKQILTIYSLENLSRENQEAARRIQEIISNGREDIPRVAAEYFSIPLEQFKFEELVNLQASLMPILPQKVYDCIAISRYFRQPMAKIKLQDLKNKFSRILWMRHQAADKAVKDDFGVNQASFYEVDEETPELAEQLFGKDFGFAWQVFNSEVKSNHWVINTVE